MPYRRQFYIPALDGLRGLAVIAVFLYHVDERRFPGGFLGVDLFFVISGYVITLGLLDEWRLRGSIDLRSFWVRRARRLVPAAVMLIFAVLGITALFFPDRMASLRGEAGAALVYLANWYLVFREVPYFEAVSAPSLLRHLWSLAVEEQFYLLWPPLLALGLRLTSPRWVLAGTVALAVASGVLLTMLYGRDASADRLYYGTDTRGFALLGGTALAFVLQPRASRAPLKRLDAASGVLGAACLVALGLLSWKLNGSYDFLYQGGLVVAALTSMGAVAMCARTDNAYTRLLESRPMRWLGTRSYSAYLWHWPIVLLLPQVAPLPGLVTLLGAAVLTLLAAEASYRWVEMPVRDRGFAWVPRAVRELQGARRGVVFAGGTCSALAVLMLTVTVARARVPEPPAYLAVPRLNAVLSADSVRASVEPTTRLGTPVAEPSATATRGTATASPPPQADSLSPASIVGPTPEGINVEGSVLAPSGAPPAPAPAAPAVPLTTAPGAVVTAIGDSVMLGAASALAIALGVVDLDAEAGRSASQVVEVVRERAAAGRIGPVVVLQVGDNGALREDRLDEAMRMLAGTRVVVVNLRVPRAWEGPNNALLAALVRRHANAALVDWHAASEGHPEYLYEDGIHLTPEGAAVYASLIAQAVR